MLQTVLPLTLRQKARGALIMPNLVPPDHIDTLGKAVAYRQRIEAAEPDLFGECDFTPVMTGYLTDEMTPGTVVHGFKEGAWRAMKLYLADKKGEGGTTNSGHGVRDLTGRYPVFEAMQEHRIPLLGHFEAAEGDVDEFDREIVSVERDLALILDEFPELPVVMEHLSDGRAADFVDGSDYKNLYATVTVHHMVANRNILFRDGMNPKFGCKPCLKREKCRQRVRWYVTSGNRQFGAGTDSAPWDKVAKMQLCKCANGNFTAPHAVESYTQIFAEDDALEHLGPFMSENFLHIYGLEPTDHMMEIEETPWTVPEFVGNVPVFAGGQGLGWKLKV